MRRFGPSPGLLISKHHTPQCTSRRYRTAAALVGCPNGSCGPKAPIRLPARAASGRDLASADGNGTGPGWGNSYIHGSWAYGVTGQAGTGQAHRSGNFRARRSGSRRLMRVRKPWMPFASCGRTAAPPASEPLALLHGPGFPNPCEDPRQAP